MMSFLTAVVTSRYPTTNNQLRNSSNPRQQATINNRRVTYNSDSWEPNTLAEGTSRLTLQSKWKQFGKQRLLLFTTVKGKDIIVQNSTLNQRGNMNKNKSVNDTLTVELERYKEQVKVLKEGQNVDLRSNDIVSDSSAQSVEIDHLKQTLSEHLKEKESLIQTVTLLKNDFKKEESLNYR
ncbi:hypothetical protein Tco_0492980 [Tanacetum coccineum]